jgi:hypothetical protein
MSHDPKRQTLVLRQIMASNLGMLWSKRALCSGMFAPKQAGFSHYCRFFVDSFPGMP